MSGKKEENKNEKHPPGVLRLFRWALPWLALLYLIGCLSGAYLAGGRLHSLYLMALFLLGFALFVLGYFQFFYPAADLSPEILEGERQRIQLPPPSRRWLAFWLSAGIIAVLLLAAWRLFLGK